MSSRDDEVSDIWQNFFPWAPAQNRLKRKQFAIKVFSRLTMQINSPWQPRWDSKTNIRLRRWRRCGGGGDWTSSDTNPRSSFLHFSLQQHRTKFFSTWFRAANFSVRNLQTERKLLSIEWWCLDFELHVGRMAKMLLTLRRDDVSIHIFQLNYLIRKLCSKMKIDSRKVIVSIKGEL